MIKAFRLKRPSLRCDASSVAAGVAGPEVAGPVSASAIGEELLLPSTFGEIFQGEAFTCYIRILSQAQHTYRDVSVKVSLKAGDEVKLAIKQHP